MGLFNASILHNEIIFFNKRQQACNEVVSKNLSDYICYHQGEFIQYAFLAGEYHKALKVEFFKEEKIVSEIIAKHDELLGFLNEKLGYIVTTSFEMIEKFFSGRHLKTPRICIKANFDPEKLIITELFREQKVKYNSDCSVNSNRGFQYIKENGKYYLCQDIPKEAKSGEYFNPRLNKGAVSNYVPENRLKRCFRTKEKIYIDENWVNCWERIKTEGGQSVKPHYRTCYKSTLITPITLWNNKLDKRFLEKFNINNVDRTIFGYLCFDHIEKNYFNSVIDVDFGYIFADILSLYLLVRFIFVNQSTTYKKVKKLLDT